MINKRSNFFSSVSGLGLYVCANLCVCVRAHASESQICSYTVKINRMALVKAVKYKTSNLLFKNALLLKVGLSESSWYTDQQTQPLRPHHHADGNSGWEDTDESLSLAK